MNTLQIFNNEEFGVITTMMIDKEVYFLGTDVAEALGYKNPGKAILNHVDEDDMKVLKYKAFPEMEKAKIWSGNDFSDKRFINESGVYALIFGSKLETAKNFKHWVTNEILPSIRKHGAYMTSDVLEASINNPDFMIGLLTELKEEQEQRKLLEIDNERMKPKEEYYDKILKAEGTFNVGQIAKDYGMSAKEFNTLLSNLKIQYKNNGQWLLYKDYQDKGYTKSEDIYKYGKVNKFTRWTPEGRVFLYEILKENGIEPIYNLKA